MTTQVRRRWGATDTRDREISGVQCAIARTMGGLTGRGSFP